MTATNGARDVERRVLVDLKRSGLTKADAKRLGMPPVSAEEMAEISTIVLPAYEIPILGATGEVRGKRYRTLPPPDENPKKFLRYFQPEGQPNLFYLPPLLKNRTWVEVSADTKVTIAMTEGEKKSATATKGGLPTIGITGGMELGLWRQAAQRYRSGRPPAVGRSARASRDP
jgi:hypothetical protein